MTFVEQHAQMIEVQVVVRRGAFRVLVVGDGLGDLASVHLNNPNVVVRHPAGRVPLQGLLKKHDGVSVDVALPPAEEGKYEENGRAGGPAFPRPDAGGPTPDAGGQSDDPEAGQVLKMVGHIGELEGVDVEESEGRKKCPDEKEEAGQQPGKSAAAAPEEGQDHGDAERKEILPGLGRIDLPVGIDEHQVGGPDQLAQIEPDDPPGQQAAGSEAESIVSPLGAAVMPLHPSGQQARGDADDEPGQQRRDIAAQFQPPSFPPQDDQQRGRQG